MQAMPQTTSRNSPSAALSNYPLPRPERAAVRRASVEMFPPRILCSSHCVTIARDRAHSSKAYSNQKILFSKKQKFTRRCVRKRNLQRRNKRAWRQDFDEAEWIREARDSGS